MYGNSLHSRSKKEWNSGTIQKDREMCNKVYHQLLGKIIQDGKESRRNFWTFLEKKEGIRKREKALFFCCLQMHVVTFNISQLDSFNWVTKIDINIDINMSPILNSVQDINRK